jgi:hypothetical protein
MSTPIIGMNPRLESPDLWTEVHHRLISAIAIHLGPTLRPKYREQAGFDLTAES